MKTTITQNQIFRSFSRLQRSCCSAVFLLLFLLSASSSWGQTFRSSSTNSVAGASITITKPLGLALGDLMIAQISRSSNNNVNMTDASSTGWTVVSGNQYKSSGSDRWHTTVLMKFATSTDVSATNFTFTGNSTDDMIGAIMAFSGACQVSVVGSWGALANDTTYSAPSITTLSANSMVVMMGSVANNGKSATDNSWTFNAVSMTERYDFDINGTKDMGIAAATLSRTSITTGVGSATIIAEDNTAILLAISPSTIAGTLSGTQTICSNGTTTFNSNAFGGTWSSGSTGVATINSLTGVITPVSAGTATMTYTVAGSGSCSNVTATRTVTVTAAPSAGTLSGTQAICSTGSTTFTSNGNSGGTWSSGSTGIATINSSGLITPVSAGTATITYTVTGTGGCVDATATRTVTVTAPNAATISFAGTPFCKSLTTAQSVTRTGTTGGTYSASPAGLTINASTGAITPSSSTAGTYTVTYTMAAAGGCNAATATTSVTITAVPSAGTLSGTLSLCPNGSSTLASTVSGGAWSSSSDAIATINSSSGLVSGVSAGSATMTYTLTGTGGCSNVTATTTVTVNSLPDAISISPNSATICNGGIQSLVASGGVVTSSSVQTLGASGSTTTASTTLLTLGPNPFQSFYGGAKQQMLFRASELTALGISNGDVISSISFNMSSVESRTLQNYVVKMKNTTTTAFASTTFETGLTTVKTAGNVTPVAGWNTLNLTSNFTYTGGNLLIEINFSNNDAGGTGTNLALFDSTSFASTLFYRVDSNTAAAVDAATTASFAAYSQRNSIKFSVTNSAQATITWSPTTALFTDAAATTAYTGTAASTVYAKPSETTTYTATATSIAGCTSSNTVQVTVNPLPTTMVLTGSTVCSGSTTTITSSTSQTGVNYQLFNSSNTAVGSAIAGTGSALTWSSIAAGTGYYVKGTNATSSCVSANSNAVNVTVNALPNSPTAISYNCTGSAVLTATAGSGETVAWYATNSQSASPVGGQVTSANTATLTISSPTAATYYAFATNANGCKSANGTETPVVVTAKNTYTGTNSDWFTAGNWSCGIVPTATTNVVIPTGKTVSISYTPGNGPAEAGTVTLEGTAALTVTTDHDLTVTGKVTVASGANFTVQNNASLKQIDNIANSGEIKVNRSTRALKLYDGVLWSSPVAGQVVNSLASGMNPNYIKYYNVAANTWNVLSNPSGTTFPKGTAYLMRTPSTGFNLNSATPWSVTFTGVPNNGDIEVTGPSVTTPSSEQYYLVGNPYPSAIDLNEFMNSNPNVTGVFYFFRKTDNSPYSAYGVLTKTQTSPGSGSYSNSYNENHPSEGAVNPNDVIPVGQGFFVTMKTGVEGKVFFNNDMRLVTNHGTFNRLQTNTEDKFKLNLTTTSNASNFSQMNLGYAEGSSSSYDVGYDAESFNDGRTNLSSMIASTPYSIQSRGNYSATDFVPLYFKTNVNGEHRIKLQDAQGVFAADQMVIIKDNLTGVQHNLTANGDYVFTSATGTFTNRFEVIYQQAYYTALQANSCGATIANMNSLVYADIVNGATGYRFKVVNNTTSAVQTIDRPQHWFAFNMLSAYDYNTPYTISVQVQKDGVWTGYYGATCTVNSPNIATTGVMQINPSQCGMTLPTLGTVIATTPVAGATGYKFRITNTTAGAIGNNLVQEITRTNHWFTLGMLSRYNYGSSYAIEVAVKTTGGYTPYGNACTVYSPAVPTLATCGQTVATATTLVRTTATNLATQYRFQVTRMSTQETITFDTANYWFSFRVNVPGYAAGEQYGVRVAVMTAGAWSPYGDACDITAPIASARTTEEAAPSEANLFKPVAYPNPFANTFGISLATPSADVVHVMVYDLQGRLIEKQNVFVSQLDSLQIGTNYPSGDYLLVVAQGANIKSSHIHKD